MALKLTDPVKDKLLKNKNNTKKIGSFRTEAEIQSQFPGAKLVKDKINQYKYKGVTLIPGAYKGEDISDAEKIKKAINEQK